MPIDDCLLFINPYKLTISSRQMIVDSMLIGNLILNLFLYTEQFVVHIDNINAISTFAFR